MNKNISLYVFALLLINFLIRQNLLNFLITFLPFGFLTLDYILQSKKIQYTNETIKEIAELKSKVNALLIKMGLMK